MSDALNKEVRVRCSIEHAFDVFTQRIDQWWPPSHRRFQASTLTLEAKPDGRFFERSEQGETADLGKVIEVERPHQITYLWYPGSSREAPTQVQISFHEEADSTRVCVLHTPGAAGDAWTRTIAKFRKSWDFVLSQYEAHASHQEQES